MKEARKKNDTLHTEEIMILLTTDFSFQTVDTKGHWDNIF